MTMASSTTKPVATMSAMSVRLLIEKPAKYMAAKVPTSDSGTATLGIMVADRLRKNKNITITTKPTDNSNSNSTSCTEARMVWVRSVRMVTLTAGGSVDCNAGNSCLMRSTTSMTFAPGWRWTLIISASDSLPHAASLLFSAPSTTLATSAKRTGAPLR